jgi:hypothetical protein
VSCAAAALGVTRSRHEGLARFKRMYRKRSLASFVSFIFIDRWLLLRFGRAEPLGVVHCRREGTRATLFLTVLIHLLARLYDHRNLPREIPAAVGECE